MIFRSLFCYRFHSFTFSFTIFFALSPKRASNNRSLWSDYILHDFTMLGPALFFLLSYSFTFPYLGCGLFKAQQQKIIFICLLMVNFCTFVQLISMVAILAEADNVKCQIGFLLAGWLAWTCYTAISAILDALILLLRLQEHLWLACFCETKVKMTVFFTERRDLL